MHLENYARCLAKISIQAIRSRSTERFGRRLSACPWEFSKRLQALGQAARLTWADDARPIPSCAARSKDFTALTAQADISPLLTQVDGGYGYCRTHGDCQGQDIASRLH